MKKLLIVSAGGNGRVVKEVAEGGIDSSRSMSSERRAKNEGNCQ